MIKNKYSGTRSIAPHLAARSSSVLVRNFEHSSSSCARTKLRFVNPRSGFTLVELLVAIAIFAVLSLLGWKIFDYLLKVRDRNTEHEVHLFELQDIYQQILRDTLQIIPLTSNQDGKIQPALELDGQTLRFSKAGVTDPLKQGLSPYERIEYRYDEEQKKLYRLKYSGLNISNREQPLSSTLLNQVEQFQVTVLNPQEMTKWPESIDPNNIQQMKQLPKGIKIQVTVAGVSYEWIYSLLDTSELAASEVVGRPSP